MLVLIVKQLIDNSHLNDGLYQFKVSAHTPSPMKFLTEILQRPSNERPFLLLVVGYPTEAALVPNIQRLPLSDIATFLK